MLDKNTMLILGGVVLLVVVVVIFMMKKKRTTEGFLGTLPRFSTNIVREVAADSVAARKGQFYAVPGFQSILAPRAASVNYGANIKHNMPAYENQGIPCNPLTFGQMAMGANWGGAFNRNTSTTAQEQAEQAPSKTIKEGYSCGGGCGSGCTPASCNTDGTPFSYRGGAPLMPADYTAGNYAEVLDDVMAEGGQTINASATLPVPTMATVNALGEVSDQPIVYDRLVTALPSKRQQGKGDQIRGDIAIAPQANTGWFFSRWAADPANSLQQGALGVMAGNDNSNFHQLAALINKTSGINTVAGVNIMTDRQAALSAGLNDLNITAFP